MKGFIKYFLRSSYNSLCNKKIQITFFKVGLFSITFCMVLIREINIVQLPYEIKALELQAELVHINNKPKVTRDCSEYNELIHKVTCEKMLVNENYTEHASEALDLFLNPALYFGLTFFSLSALGFLASFLQSYSSSE
ncbi:hypothetical protein [Alteromonas lipotrueae]|uniref:hypothetical protein n=1 Tax=Alteromonas lipotrueae TaxID=2803814 RepID=UPI001C4503E0|nr:hypothetical protein [Alteromonas lipotrueae]